MNYLKRNKKSLMMLAIALVVILVSSFFASMIQSDFYAVKVTDLRNEENVGDLYQADGVTVKTEDGVKGKVVSGILFMPKDASSTNKKPAVIMTHGYLNNRELQLQNAIELARRGFIVLTVDREGHGNYLPTSDSGSAMMNTNGLYDSAKYVYNLPEVDKTKVGITGHSMGGYTTAMTLMSDASVGIISAGLMQGWSTFIAAGANVDVGMLKAQDDEFFFTSKFPNGDPSICREYLQSTGAANFVKDYSYTTTGSVDIKSGDKYVNGNVVTAAGEGKAIDGAFRVIYEANEIHPLNHFSTESASYVVDFFYNAFGTPKGESYIAPGAQTWWVKEAFSTIGLAAFFFMIFPLISLLLTAPCFASLNKPEDLDLNANLPSIKDGSAKGITSTVLYFVSGIATMLFGGFILKDAYTEWGSRLVPQGTYFPQDTTGNIAGWALICAGFAVFVMGIVWIIKLIVGKATAKDGEVAASYSPFNCAKISIANFLKTVCLAITTIALLYAVVFINWEIFKVDFRIWTLDVKPFMIEIVPAISRYIPLFFAFYAINAIGNAGFRLKDLPEWATIAINAFFNAAGVLLVILIQYITFRSTGVLWQSEMALGYIVVFPMVAVLAIATIISRVLYKKTGNIWLGAMINAILFTIITCANTAAGYIYAWA